MDQATFNSLMVGALRSPTVSALIRGLPWAYMVNAERSAYWTLLDDDSLLFATLRALDAKLDAIAARVGVEPEQLATIRAEVDSAIAEHPEIDQAEMARVILAGLTPLEVARAILESLPVTDAEEAATLLSSEVIGAARWVRVGAGGDPHPADRRHRLACEHDRHPADSSDQRTPGAAGTAAPAGTVGTRRRPRPRSPPAWWRCTPPTRRRCTWRRWPGCGTATVADVERALYDDRSLVRLLGMRRTMFVAPVGPGGRDPGGRARAVAVRQRRRYARSDRRGRRDVRHRRGRLAARRGGGHAAGAAPPAARRPARELSADEPRLRTSVADRRGQVVRGHAANITTWVLVLLALDGRIVRGRPRGTWISSQYRWAPMDAWLPGGLTELADRRRPGGAGPAVARRVRPGHGRRPALVDRLDGGRGEAGAGRARARSRSTWRTAAPGLLLPDDVEPVTEPPSRGRRCCRPSTRRRWAGPERDWYLGPHKAALFDRNGNIGPTIWWDGRIVGGWAQRRDGDARVPPAGGRRRGRRGGRRGRGRAGRRWFGGGRRDAPVPHAAGAGVNNKRLGGMVAGTPRGWRTTRVGAPAPPACPDGPATEPWSPPTASAASCSRATAAAWPAYRMIRPGRTTTAGRRCRRTRRSRRGHPVRCRRAGGRRRGGRLDRARTTRPEGPRPSRPWCIGSPHGSAAHLAATLGAPWLPPASSSASGGRGGDGGRTRSARSSTGASAARQRRWRRIRSSPCARSTIRSCAVGRPARRSPWWPGGGGCRRRTATSWLRRLRPGAPILLVHDARTWPVFDLGGAGERSSSVAPLAGLEPEDYLRPGRTCGRRCGWPAATRSGGPAGAGADGGVRRARPGGGLRGRRSGLGDGTGPRALRAVPAPVRAERGRGRGGPGVAGRRRASPTTGSLWSVAGCSTRPRRCARGLVPYWCESALRTEVTDAEWWLAGSRRFRSIDVLVEPPGRPSSVVAPAPQWNAVAWFGGRRGAVDRAGLRGYPYGVLPPRHARRGAQRAPRRPAAAAAAAMRTQPSVKV